jgi:hypothetical protein
VLSRLRVQGRTGKGYAMLGMMAVFIIFLVYKGEAYDLLSLFSVFVKFSVILLCWWLQSKFMVRAIPRYMKGLWI